MSLLVLGVPGLVARNGHVELHLRMREDARHVRLRCPNQGGKKESCRKAASESHSVNKSHSAAKSYSRSAPRRRIWAALCVWQVSYIFSAWCFLIHSGSISTPNPGPVGTLIFPSTTCRRDVLHSNRTLVLNPLNS